MHWKRLLTAGVLIPPLILLVLKSSPAVFSVALVCVSLIALWEYLRIVCDSDRFAVSLLSHLWAYTFGAAIIWLVHLQRQSLLAALLALGLMIGGGVAIARYRTDTKAPFIMIKQFFGLIYIPLLLSFLIPIRNSGTGPLWVIFLLWIVAWGDTGALYVGTTLGQHKLCPSVSPKKTIEGALGGLAANLVFAWLFKLLFFSALSGVACTIFALGVGLAGQVGDLFESLFKRAGGVKDSSALLPGHGGILDRIDALLFAAPMAYLIKDYLLP